MLVRRLRKTVFAGLTLLFALSGCFNNTQHTRTWENDKLVAQLYRQYKSEILLTYNDLKGEVVVDAQDGYARAYFDNYRKQVIFAKDRTLEYLINGVEMTTTTADITGYPADMLFNETYQVAVEVLDVKSADLTSNEFDGARSRIININTGANIIVDGLLFNRNLLVGDYFYGFTFDNDRNQLFDIVNLKTMEHKRITNKTDKFSFIYESAGEVYVQVASKQTAFTVVGFDLHEKQDLYDATLPHFEHGAQILKDIAPQQTSEHWYVQADEEHERIARIRLLRTTPNGRITQQPLAFDRSDMMQVIDVARYGNDQIALLLLTKDADDSLHTLLAVFTLEGELNMIDDVTRLLEGDKGRFTYLDYVD